MLPVCYISSYCHHHHDQPSDGAEVSAEHKRSFHQTPKCKHALVLNVCHTTLVIEIEIIKVIMRVELYLDNSSLGALRAQTSGWRPFRPLDFVLRALRALRPCDPRVGD